MVAVYLDNSVIDPIATKHASGAVRALMNQQNGVVHASIQNLLEAWRIDDAAQRGQFIETALALAPSREEEPILLTAAQGLVEEIRLHHPDWLVAGPDLGSHAEHRDTRLWVWRKLEKDPTYRPKNFLAQQQFLYEAIGASMERQRVVRRARRAGIAIPSPVESIGIAVALQPLVDALPDPEADWREGGAAAWWRGAMGGDKNLSDLRDYLRPYLAADHVTVEPWMRFWLIEASGTALPIIRAEGLAQHFQPDHRIGPGNWGDINHAGSAVGRDFILTADHDYFDVLTNIQQEPNMALAAPRLIDRDGADIVAEIGRALGW
jgi:hypothetical protein